MHLLLLPLLAPLGCALVADTAGIEIVGTIGTSRFWHDHAVQDVHVADDGTLRSLAGCTIRTWSEDGQTTAEVTLEDCTPGLNDGFFSPDGQWVAASGLWDGEQGVWRADDGTLAHEVESISWSRFCAGGLWDVDGGFRRLDLKTGEVTHPSGDHSTGFACIGDAWMLDEHGHRIEPDGTVVELPEIGDIPDVVGQTDDGRAIAYLYGERLVLVDRDGGVTEGAPVPDLPEKVIVHNGVFLALDDGVDDVVWHIDASGRLVDRSFSEGAGLDARPGTGALFVWNDGPWGWGGQRLFPLGEPTGPVDSLYERFFFDADELYLCHGSRCEARRLDALDGTARIVELPDQFSDETKVSPWGRFLGQYDTEQLFRTTLDTGEVAAQPVSEWVDGLSVDAAGHFRWRLSADEDEDDVWETRVYERRDGAEVVLGEWRESWLSDPGWSVLRLGPVLRWANGAKAGDEDADNWFESPQGLAFLATPYGSGLQVYDGAGTKVASSSKQVDNAGPWGAGAWVGRGQKVVFLAPDLTEQARLTIPWRLGDWAVEAAASPDGRYFAARGPEGTLTVWRLPEALATPVPQLPEPEPLAQHATLEVGEQLGAPTLAVAEVSLFPEAPLAYLEGPRQLVVAMAAFAPRTQQERAEHLAAIRGLSSGWDDERLYYVKDHFLAVHTGGTWYDEESEERPGDPELLAKQLAAAVKQHNARKPIRQYEAWWAAQPVPDTPAFGIEACPPQSAEVGATMPVPPAASQDAERTLVDSIVVRVAADGTPRWVANGPNTRNSDGRACFAEHSGPWTPAQKDGAAIDLCVRVPCWE